MGSVGLERTSRSRHCRPRTSTARVGRTCPGDSQHCARRDRCRVAGVLAKPAVADGSPRIPPGRVTDDEHLRGIHREADQPTDEGRGEFWLRGVESTLTLVADHLSDTPTLARFCCVNLGQGSRMASFCRVRETHHKLGGWWRFTHPTDCGPRHRRRESPPTGAASRTISRSRISRGGIALSPFRSRSACNSQR